VQIVAFSVFLQWGSPLLLLAYEMLQSFITNNTNKLVLKKLMTN